jgi:hypothetical protein
MRAPVFLSSLTHKPGRSTPPRPSQFRCSPQIKKKLFPETKGLPSGPNSGRQGHIFFHWAKLHPTKLRCTLLSYAAPPWSTLHPIEQRCTLLSYAAFQWAMLHPIWTLLHPKSYATPSELSCTLLSYAAPFWAKLHPSEISCTLPELRCALRASLHPLS